MPILCAERLRRTYLAGTTPVEALRGIDLSLDPGELVAVMGPSGCGKSTFLHLCGGMDRPTAGRVLLQDVSLGELDDDRLTRLRRQRIGFVFQLFNLLPTLTVAENIALPLLLDGLPAKEAAARATAMAERVDMSHRLAAYPQQLSGGEMQRAAIARAVVHEPVLIVADEPTGNLDSENGSRVLGLLVALNRERGVTILLATHSAEIAAAAGRVVHMRDGVIERISSPPVAVTERLRQVATPHV